MPMMPIVGPVRDWVTAPGPTPQYHCWPLHIGERILAMELTATQQCTVTVQFFDKHGNPATVDGIPTWMSDNTDVLALTPGADGLSCLVAARGALGAAMVTMQADCDLGAGVEPLYGTLAFNVTGGKAATVELTPGAPEEQPGTRRGQGRPH